MGGGGADAFRPASSCANENCTGLAQTMGQLSGSNRDFQTKCWAKFRNLGQPRTIFVGAGRMYTSLAIFGQYLPPANTI
jgi:hypothetical protein